MLRRYLSPICSLLVCLVLISAAVVKLSDLPTWIKHLAQWKIIPAALLYPLGTGVPLAELTIVGLWASGSRSRLAPILAALMLVVFTGAYVAETIINKAPDCNCFGAMDRFIDFKQGLWGVVIRNGVLFALCIPPIVLRRRSGNGEAPCDHDSQFTGKQVGDQPPSQPECEAAT